ncbi:MAG: protein translocase subunit SecD [bacterium]
MNKIPRWKIWLLVVVIITSIIYIVPTLLGKKRTSVWPGWLPDDTIQLGLDLQGGMHLVLGVKTEEAVKSTLVRYSEDIREELRNRKVALSSVDVKPGYQVEMVLFNADKRQVTKEVMSEYDSLFDYEFREQKKQVTLSLTLKQREIKRIRQYAIDQGLETIRNRVDQFGVAEPNIQRQGKDRILIQLPGIKDSKRAIKLIGKTARLEFMMVDDEHDLEQALKGRVPVGSVIRYEREVNKQTGKVTKKPLLLKNKILMTGEVISGARVNIDQNYGSSYVIMHFDKRGKRIFARITEQNIKKRMAIILDGVVYSAPVIQEKIAGGRAQITGRFTAAEAHDLAIVLRAGALPAPVEILEERTIGPSLGHDSIQMGFNSILISGLAVLVFMVLYYKLSGIVADLALFLNMLLVFSFMAAVDATLTLPGIAGLVLTIGMAVDANVLIYERIREELRFGKSARIALENGYGKAFVTILDSNLTTLLAAALLYQFGTGPIKGFAVTLFAGISASLFTAIFVTRLIFDLFLSRRTVNSLSI